VAKKQPAYFPLPPGFDSLCERGLGTEGMYEHSGQVARSHFDQVWRNRNSSPYYPLNIDDWLIYK